MLRRRTNLLAVAAFATVVLACTSATPVPTSTGSPTLAPSLATAGPAAAAATQQPGLPWSYADIQQPEDVLTVGSLPPIPNCHPCHYEAENDLFAISSWQNGLISIGSLQPPPQPLAFTSTDGASWDVVTGLSAHDNATSTAVASDGNRTVLVGNEHLGATAWAYDGSKWTQAPEQDSLHVDYAAGGMLAVIPFQGGWVGGGYCDDPLHDKHIACAWRSPDGLTWTRDADPGNVFAGGRIWTMTSIGDTIVALGTNGDEIYGPAGAWIWNSADGWQQSQFAPDNGGAVAAVTVTRDGRGYIAVGKNAKDLGAAVWTSPDGKVWTAVPDQPSFHFYLLALRMASIVAGPDYYLVGGWRSDQAKGSGVLWRSTDGQTWTDPEWQTTFSGGEIDGVALTDQRAIAVGRTGYPDWNKATIWVRPLPY
jgi:hypothetical protein